MKRLLVIGTILCSIILVLPAMLVVFFSNGEKHVEPTTAEMKGETPLSTQEQTLGEDVSVAVYRSQKNEIETIGLEEYVIGVVSSEMPVSFELEALKAQALAARTFIVKQMLIPSDIVLPEGAMVTDTINHQVYQSKEELKQRWGAEYDWKIKRVEEAVRATAGQILTYGGQPITASFFSTSNGFTENSEDYWQNEIPYLRSVESRWDEMSPRFTSSVTFSISELENKLNVSLPNTGAIGEITERTESNRVAKVRIGGKEFTGRQIREKLDLDSTDFQLRRQGNQIVIETKGWGHGVGMSQYGADGMAKEGYSYKDIISHYYKGVSLSHIEPYIGQLMAVSN